MSTEPPDKVIAELQKLEPDAEIELFELDASIFGGAVYLFHNQRTQGETPILFGGFTYNPIPFKADGFAFVGTEQMPTPSVFISSLGGIITSLIEQYDDLTGCTLRRLRTFRKYLDDGSEPDSTARLSDDVYFVNRKKSESKLEVEFELASSLDVDGVTLPRRKILGRCQAPRFKDGFNCPYTGADTTCLKTPAACAAKFPNRPLPFMGFPAVERLSFPA